MPLKRSSFVPNTETPIPPVAIDDTVELEFAPPIVNTCARATPTQRPKIQRPICSCRFIENPRIGNVHASWWCDDGIRADEFKRDRIEGRVRCERDPRLCTYST